MSNTWLDCNAQYHGEANFVKGIKLRTETYPCKATMALAGHKGDTVCQHCKMKVETIGHISGWCPKVKGYRIKKPNDRGP
jgi:hypothetical protein